MSVFCVFFRINLFWGKDASILEKAYSQERFFTAPVWLEPQQAEWMYI